MIGLAGKIIIIMGSKVITSRKECSHFSWNLILLGVEILLRFHIKNLLGSWNSSFDIFVQMVNLPTFYCHFSMHFIKQSNHNLGPSLSFDKLLKCKWITWIRIRIRIKLFLEACLLSFIFLGESLGVRMVCGVISFETLH